MKGSTRPVTSKPASLPRVALIQIMDIATDLVMGSQRSGPFSSVILMPRILTYGCDVSEGKVIDILNLVSELQPLLCAKAVDCARPKNFGNYCLTTVGYKPLLTITSPS